MPSIPPPVTSPYINKLLGKALLEPEAVTSSEISQIAESVLFHILSVDRDNFLRMHGRKRRAEDASSAAPRNAETLHVGAAGSASVDPVDASDEVDHGFDRRLAAIA